MDIMFVKGSDMSFQIMAFLARYRGSSVSESNKKTLRMITTLLVVLAIVFAFFIKNIVAIKTKDGKAIFSRILDSFFDPFLNVIFVKTPRIIGINIRRKF